MLGAVRVNETDTFADEDGANDEYFDFEDISGISLPALLDHFCAWNNGLRSMSYNVMKRS